MRSLERQREKIEKQAEQHLTMAKTKLEKEQENVAKLTRELELSLGKYKEMQTSVSRITVLETEKAEYEKKSRSYKAQLTKVKEEYEARMSSLVKIESEYKSYRSEVETKMVAYEKLDDDVFRLRAEIKELKARNERMQKRLAEKESEIKDLESR